jgi:predicted phage terminase large subunit-like protein
MDESELVNILVYSSNPSKFIHDIIGLEVKPFHKEWIDLYESNKRVCLLAPRSTGKSLITSSYIIWKICTDPKIRILLVTMSQTKAEEMMSFIKQQLESNTKLINLFGEQESPLWSKSEIRIKNRGPGIIHKEPTLQVLGVNSSQISSHYDLIVFDDIVDNINSLTRSRRRKIEEWFNNALMPMLEPDGTIIDTGTRWHSDDFHQYLSSKMNTFITKIYKAIINVDTKEVIWPERFSYEDLIDLRDNNIGKTAFQLQYQNEINQTEDSPIKEEWIDKSIDAWNLIDKQGKYITYMGVDLASKSSEGDYFSITVVGVDDKGLYWVLDSLRDKISMNKQLEIIKSLYIKWNPKYIGIESNATQRIITDQWMEDTPLPIVQLKSSWINDKWSRVQRISVLLETGRLIINPKLDVLCDELVTFPRGAFDDEIDSLSFAIQSSGEEEEKGPDWGRVLDVISSRQSKSFIKI